MRVRPVRGPGRAAALTCFVVFVVCCVAGCTAGRASSDPTDQSDTGQSDTGQSATAQPTIAGTAVQVLQLNLCNSGRADCYSGGRAIGRAVALIREDQPTVVTLNEICRDDLAVLEQTMSTTAPAEPVATAFAAVMDRQTQEPVRCRNGQDFGAGVLVAAPPTVVVRTYAGANPVQDTRDPEERVWVCIDLTGRFTACTTHSTSANRTIALEQCQSLLKTVLPRMTGRDAADPVILGADLNLPAHGSPSPQDCLPAGYRRTDDDSLQHVVVSAGVALRSHSVIDMQGTTDHPGLLVDVVVPVAPTS